MNRATTPPSLLKLCGSCALILGLVACGGGSDDDAQGAQAPDFSGTYQVSMTKTRDDCNSGIDNSLNTQQVVSQTGRDVRMSSGSITLAGTVDADNNGFSLTANVALGGGGAGSYGKSYRATGAAGVYQAGLSIRATTGGTSCTVTYSGEARRL